MPVGGAGALARPSPGRGSRVARETHAARCATSSSSHAAHSPASASGRIPKRQQRVVHLVGVARVRPRLPAHLGDRLGIERADAGGEIGIGAAQRHGARATLLERRVVEEGVRVGVEDLVRDRRRRRGLDRDGADGARLDAVPARRASPSASIASCRQLSSVSLHQRMVGRLDRSDLVVAAGELGGKDRGEQILGAHALQRHRHPAPAGEAQQRQRPGDVPAPAVGEHRRHQRGLHEIVAEPVRPHHGEDAFEREAVLLAERQDDAVVGGGRLQLEVEADAEALAQREAEGAVDAPAERRVQDQLHAAALVEEALGDDGVERRHGAERGQRVAQVGDDLLGAAAIDVRLVHQPAHRRLGLRSRRAATSRRRSATAADSSGVRAGASPSQNGMVGGAPWASTTRTRPASTRRMRQERLPSRKMSPGQALDGEVLVHLADHGAAGVLDHVVVRHVGDGPAAGDRGQARTAPRRAGGRARGRRAGGRSGGRDASTRRR